MPLTDLKPEVITRVQTAMSRRAPERRSALADLLAGTHGVEQIAVRLGYSTVRSVYELVARFERDVQHRFEWPWRKAGHPGPKPSENFLPRPVNEKSLSVN